ncbi:hypothetical protein Sru01_26080 [Sphaerisporangium rufum]|uniref:HTH tetR-type domain-containing protein n=1 Tax=Sphaerisporangium rufum TaxID=1381558 RepID=A0A919R3B0_9ACTN|nr:TetR/AcrR family transcriptional regulator [Sphaerisporangium rufum]GII77626.1 hypothetical protein Sru01_26080 [Sphaerisporangium rufum]
MSPTGPDPEDLTARARIRDAAMRHFGEYGYERATIRGIAESAGVSSGLVRHHFGSKQALREACDAHLIKQIRRLNDDVRSGRMLHQDNPIATTNAALGPYRRYLAHALVAGSAEAVFDQLVELAEEWFAENDPRRPDAPQVGRRARAAAFTAMALSTAVLRDHVARAMGVDLDTPEGELLLARTLLDLYSHPVLGTDEAAEYTAALGKLPPGRPARP